VRDRGVESGDVAPAVAGDLSATGAPEGRR
jgi:hypothetical protein